MPASELDAGLARRISGQFAPAQALVQQASETSAVGSWPVATQSDVRSDVGCQGVKRNCYMWDQSVAAGPTRTSGGVRFGVAFGGVADIKCA